MLKEEYRQAPENSESSCDTLQVNQMLVELESKAQYDSQLAHMSAPAINKITVEISNIERLLKTANLVQQAIEREREADERARSTAYIATIRSHFDEKDGLIALEEIFTQAESVGISREAVQKAYDALSLNDKWEDTRELLAVKLGLPPDSSVQAIEIEEKLRCFVNDLLPDIKSMLVTIWKNPLVYPEKTMSLAQLPLNVGPVHRAFEERSFDLSSIAKLPFLAVQAISRGDVSFSSILSPNLKTPTSPALKELIQCAEEHGGMIELICEEDLLSSYRVKVRLGFQDEK